ncbi:uncharacterized protein [Paramormyrops kingsleyae]|uniref:uncharacterized protein isoform X2 n=1 Tax=Paramormyrops kingsleyae TaxID=1676925 RepID=UPI003B972673
MTDNCAGSVTCSKMNEKENARVLGPRLQRRSLPASKSPSPQVPKPAPLSHLALARRPLRDTKNVIKESNRQAPPAALTSTEGSRKYGWENVKQSAVTCNVAVPATGQTGRLVSQAFKGGFDSQPDLSLAENEEGEVSCEGERFPSASSLLETQKLLPELLDEAAPLYEGHPASDIMNRTWSNPEGPFFPSLQKELQEGEDEESSQNGVIQQGGKSVSLRPGSVHASLRHKRFEAKHRKCLTPIFEVSPLKEGEAVETAGGDIERIAALYQNFFAEECAVVIDNIRRTSYQEVLGGGFSAKSSTDMLDIPNIKEESLPTWNYLNTSLEGSAVPLEFDVAQCDVSFLPLNLDGKRGTDKSEENQVGKIPESRGCNLTFSLEDDLSVLMGKTQSIHQSEASDSLLENTYNLCDQEGDLGKDVLKGPIQNLTVESGRSLDAKTYSKEDISADVNSNGTYVLQSDGPDAGPDVTSEVKEQSAHGSDARGLTKTSSSSCNDTYEMQPTEERGCVRVDRHEEGGTEKLKPGLPQREIVAESLSDHSVNGAEKGMLSLENTLDLTDNFLVTSTPMPARKLPDLTKEIDSDPSEVCKQLMDSVNMCSQAMVDGVDGDVPSFHPAALPVDGADGGGSSLHPAALPVDGADGGGSSFHPAALPVDGADGGGSSLHTSGVPLTAVKVAVPNPPDSAAPAPRQDAASRRLSVPLQRRSLLPPLSGLRDSKADQPLAQPASSRRLSLPATAKSLAARKVPGAGALSSYGKKTEAASRSPAKQPKASVEASAVLKLSKEKSAVADGKLPACRLQRPRASGIPAPSSCTSRLSLGVSGRAEAAELKRKSIPAPATGQKRPRGGPQESLSVSKQKRVDVPPSDVPKGQVHPVSRNSGLQRPTTALKDLEAKANADTSSCSSGGTLKESSKRAAVTQGLRKLMARVGASDPKPNKAACSLEHSASQAGLLVPSVTDRPAPAAGAEPTSFAGTAACEAAAEVAIKHTDCQDCVRYREEINRLRSALRALTGIVE